MTGAAGGLGLALTGCALAQGDAVVATARNPDRVRAAFGETDRLLAVPLDVTHEQQAHAAVRDAVARFDHIDVLVNNAGRGFVGAVEEASAEELQAIFTVNVFGLLSVTRAVLPVMRARRSGRVINIGSVGGLISRAGAGVYDATKFAVEGLSEAMRAELEPLGIHVSVIEPGGMRTNFLATSSLLVAKRHLSDYEPTAGQFRTRMTAAHRKQSGDPERVAATIIDVANSPEPPFRVPLGRAAFENIDGKLRGLRLDLMRWRTAAGLLDFQDEVGAG